jgi:hypothetical protein
MLDTNAPMWLDIVDQRGRVEAVGVAGAVHTAVITANHTTHAAAVFNNPPPPTSPPPCPRHWDSYKFQGLFPLWQEHRWRGWGTGRGWEGKQSMARVGRRTCWQPVANQPSDSKSAYDDVPVASMLQSCDDSGRWGTGGHTHANEDSETGLSWGLLGCVRRTHYYPGSALCTIVTGNTKNRAHVRTHKGTADTATLAW